MIVGSSTGELEERNAIMGDSAPGQQPPDAHDITEDKADAEPQPEPQAKPAPPPSGDLAQEKAPESKFHG